MSKFLNISTDNTLGGNSASDDTVSSQKAVKEYVDSHGGGGSSYTAGTGIDITNDVISVKDTILSNRGYSSPNNFSLGILGAYSDIRSCAVWIGYGSSAYNNAVSLGFQASANNSYSMAIGYNAVASANYAIQIGYGTNSEANSVYFATSSSNNYKMLGNDGLIPDARISSNIARTTDIPAAQVNSDWNAVSGVAQILNKPTLGTMASESASDYTPTSGLSAVATSGSYNDLSNKPTIPTVDQTYDGTSTNAQSGVAVASAISGKANTDLSNLTSQGQNIANWSTNVTNCITEIPQNIKLELNNGTLTLKAGSKVYVPNGVGVYDTRVTTSDSSWILNSNNIMVYVNPDGNIDVLLRNYCYSGSTAPTSFQDNKYAVWYDTTNNVVKRTGDAGVTWTTGYSLPVYIADSDNSYQVFNGFGYIGSTIFALPGVKGLIPNGRNADGTLKSSLMTISSVIVNSTPGNGDRISILNFDTNAFFGRFYTTVFVSNSRPSIIVPGTQQQWWYNPSENIMYRTMDAGTSWSKVNGILVGRYSLSSGVFSSFTTKSAFHALDYNDSPTISGWSMPSSRYIDLTLGASGTTYTAPANGYFNFIYQGSNGQWIFMVNTTTSFEVDDVIYNQGFARAKIEARKGESIRCDYTTNGSYYRLRFIYAEGENS